MSDQTRQIIAEMLAENVGSSFMDSGGTPIYDADGNYTGSTQGYGRAFERNTGKTVDYWESQPRATLDGRYGDIDVTVSLYHFLANRLAYEPELDRLWQAWTNARRSPFAEDIRGFPYVLAGYQRFGEYVQDWAGIAAEHWESYDKPDNYDDDDDSLAEHARILEERLEALWVIERADPDEEPPDSGRVTDGLWGDASGPLRENSYNGECLLSQTIQVTLFGLDGNPCSGDEGPFVLLEIHGGADVRGGYTFPRLFSLRDDASGLLSWSDATLQADDAEHSWYTDDAWNWYHSGLRLNLRKDATFQRVQVPEDAQRYARAAAAHWRIRQEYPRPTGATDLALLARWAKDREEGLTEHYPDAEALQWVCDDDNAEKLILVYDDDGNMYDPLTGGKLHADAW